MPVSSRSRQAASPSLVRIFALIAVAAGTAAAASAGCGTDATGELNAGPDGSTGASGGSGTSGSGTSGNATSGGGTSGTSGSGTSGSGTSGSGASSGELPDVQFIYNPPDRDSSLTGDSACAQSSATATLQPLDMFIMFDASQSMKYDSGHNLLSQTDADCNVNASPVKDSRWCKSVVALSAYLNASASTGNAAALQFFGPNNQCSGTSFDHSVQPGGTTGYTPLPSNLFDDDLNAAAPDQDTPLQGAIDGMIAFSARAANRRAGRTTIGVLITDADTGTLQCVGPEGLTAHIASLKAALQTQFTNNGIRTFVVGMTGADFGVIETLAQGGNAPSHGDTVGTVTDACGNGAGPCQSWNVGNGNGNVLTEALKQIQQAAIGCTYNMPTTDAGVINPANVSVEYQPNGNPALAVELTHVANEAACVPNGWYYDNDTTPTTLNLCPAECTTVQADANAKVRVLLGCLGG